MRAAFNTGVLLVIPSLDMHSRLVAAAQETGETTEQGFLNSFFAEWFSQPKEHRLPFADNVVSTIAWYYSPAWEMLRQRMRVLHFAGVRSGPPSGFASS